MYVYVCVYVCIYVCMHACMYSRPGVDRIAGLSKAQKAIFKTHRHNIVGEAVLEWTEG